MGRLSRPTLRDPTQASAPEDLDPGGNGVADLTVTVPRPSNLRRNGSSHCTHQGCPSGLAPTERDATWKFCGCSELLAPVAKDGGCDHVVAHESHKQVLRSGRAAYESIDPAVSDDFVVGTS